MVIGETLSFTNEYWVSSMNSNGITTINKGEKNLLQSQLKFREEKKGSK